jgi:hypothetical protein
VRPAGFEPATPELKARYSKGFPKPAELRTHNRSTGIIWVFKRPLASITRIDLVGAAGLEPAKPKAGDLQSPAIAAMRYSQIVGQEGFEPSPPEGTSFTDWRADQLPN